MKLFTLNLSGNSNVIMFITFAFGRGSILRCVARRTHARTHLLSVGATEPCCVFSPLILLINVICTTNNNKEIPVCVCVCVFVFLHMWGP